jgi:hypothetical protein
VRSHDSGSQAQSPLIRLIEMVAQGRSAANTARLKSA